MDKEEFDLSYIFKEDSELLKRYNQLVPFFLLINYRVKIDGYEGLFANDDSYQKNWSLVHWMRYISTLPIYALRRIIAGIKRKNVNERVLLSDTYIQSSRYNQSLEELFSDERVCGQMSINNSNILAILKSFSYKGVEKAKYNKADVPLGVIAADFKLKSAVVDVFNFFAEIRTKSELCDDYYERSTALFEKLKDACETNISKLVKELNKYNIRQFITVNEYNLKDLLIIQALKRIPGAVSKYYCHHVFFIAFDAKVTESNFIFCDKAYYWCEEDVSFVNTYMRLVDCIPKPEFRVAGTPEISLRKLHEGARGIERQRKMLFLVPHTLQCLGDNVDLDEFNIDQFSVWRKSIFYGLREFGKNNAIQITVRHNPYENPKAIEYDKVLIDECGFKVADGSSEIMRREMMTSLAVMGCCSSAEYIGLIYGCEVLSLNADNTILMEDLGSRIYKIDIDELKCVELRNITTEPLKDYCFDMDRLLAV